MQLESDLFFQRLMEKTNVVLKCLIQKQPLLMFMGPKKKESMHLTIHFGALMDMQREKMDTYILILQAASTKTSNMFLKK